MSWSQPGTLHQSAGHVLQEEGTSLVVGNRRAFGRMVAVYVSCLMCLILLPNLIITPIMMSEDGAATREVLTVAGVLGVIFVAMITVATLTIRSLWRTYSLDASAFMVFRIHDGVIYDRNGKALGDASDAWSSQRIEFVQKAFGFGFPRGVRVHVNGHDLYVSHVTGADEARSVQEILQRWGVVAR